LPTRSRWNVLGVMLYLQVASASVQVGVATMSPVLQTDFGLSLQGVGLLLSAVNLGMTIGLLPWGALTDRYGEKLVLLVGFGGAATCLLAGAVTSGFPAALVALACTGLFLSSSIPAGGISILRAFDARERGLAFGVRLMGGPAGGVLAALAVPALLAHWQRPGVLACLAVACGVGVTAVGLVITSRRGEGHRGAEREARHIDRRIVRIAVASFLLQAASIASISYAVQFLNGERGMGLGAAGATLAISQAGGAVGRVLVGRLSDRLTARLPLARWLMAFAGIGLGLLAGVCNGPLLPAAATLVVCGALSQAPGGLLLTATAEIAGHRSGGVGVAVQQTSIGVSATALPILYAALVSATSWSWGFAIAGLCCLAAAAVLCPRDAGRAA
jgi:MFS family permease